MKIYALVIGIDNISIFPKLEEITAVITSMA
jgi:hypothetical protein